MVGCQTHRKTEYTALFRRTRQLNQHKHESDIVMRVMPKPTLIRMDRRSNTRVFQGNLEAGEPKQQVTLAVGFDGQMFLLVTYMTTKDSWLAFSYYFWNFDDSGGEERDEGTPLGGDDFHPRHPSVVRFEFQVVKRDSECNRDSSDFWRL